ncbi:hypothetical protein TNCT_241201 [Trichonephila clavata]|uniref:Uncharacterized protein n=1 Tax=Trichonephila clavata TaxID=2740835 RepID=A0A8X6L3U9_TRICU|nr:hypothetical protein TNCT_241201 [Trichonephila clavata]
MQFIKITVFLWFAYSSNCHTNDKDFNKNLLTKRSENLEQSSIPYSDFFKDDGRRDIDDKNPFREKLKTSYLLPEYILKKLQILRKNDYSPKSTIGYILKSNIQPELLSEIKNLNSENPTLLRNKKGNKRAVVSQLKKVVNYSDPDENRRNQYPVLKKSLEKANKKIKLKDLNFRMTISALDFLTEHSGVESKGSTPTVKNKKRISLKKMKNKNSNVTTLSHSKNLEIDALTELITEASFSVDSAKTLLKNKDVKVAARTKPSVYGLKSKEGTKDLEIDTFTEAGSLIGNAKTLLKDKESKALARTKPSVYDLKNKGGTTTVKSQEKESAIERTDIELRSESPVTMFILEIIGDTSASIESEPEEIGNSTYPRSSTELFTTQEYVNDYGIPENGLQKFLSVSEETQPAVRATSEE